MFGVYFLKKKKKPAEKANAGFEIINSIIVTQIACHHWLAFGFTAADASYRRKSRRQEVELEL